jgi:hypothetical protein
VQVCTPSLVIWTIESNLCVRRVFYRIGHSPSAFTALNILNSLLFFRSPLIKRFLHKPGEEEQPQMCFKLHLTENPTRPIVSQDFSPKVTKAVKSYENSSQKRLFLQECQTRRKQIFETYEKERDKALRDIHAIRREKAYDQVWSICRRKWW